MSALAVLLHKNGHHISGSDRGFDANENNEIKNKLLKQGIVLFADIAASVVLHLTLGS